MTTVAAIAVAVLLFTLLVALPGRAQATTYSTQELELLRLLNDYRQGLGLQPLMVSDVCSLAAERHGSDMAKYHFFGHTTMASDFFPVGANPRLRMAMSGYSYTTAWGEDIAGGFPTASEVLDAWEGSPEHNKQLTDPAYKVVGIAQVYTPGSDYSYYWTLDFGAFVDQTAHWPEDSSPGSSTTTTEVTGSTTTTTSLPSTTTTTSPPPTTTTTSTTAVSPFADVRPASQYYAQISALAQAGIVSGYEDGLFHPEREVTRAQLAKMVVLAIGAHTAQIDNALRPSFVDLPFTGAAYPFDYVEEAAALGIVRGFADGTFRPNDPIIRAQTALMLARAGGARLQLFPEDDPFPFMDVPLYAQGAVHLLLYNKLVSGKTPTIFDPYDPTTRGEVAKLIFGLREVFGH